jgi:4-amino-4-deoxychorismate lyase
MMLVDGSAASCVEGGDRGLAYGDGLFETLAMVDGRVLALDQHLERFERDAARLGLRAPPRATVIEEMRRLTAGHDRGVLKLTLTRGSGGRGYRSPMPQHERRILSLHPWPEIVVPRNGLCAFICGHPLSTNPLTAGIKHLNRLDQVLASRHWPADDPFEGLMLDADGGLVEGTRSNVFLVRDQTLLTPLLDRAGVAGIVRAALIALAPAHGMAVEVRRIAPAEIGEAEELFITNSIIGVRSIAEVTTDRSRMFTAHAVADRCAAALRRAAVIA